MRSLDGDEAGLCWYRKRDHDDAIRYDRSRGRTEQLEEMKAGYRGSDSRLEWVRMNELVEEQFDSFAKM